MTGDYELEALRDGAEAARERQQAEQEMEQALIKQEIDKGSTSLGIAEQSVDGQTHDDGTDVVFVGGVGQPGHGDHIDAGIGGMRPNPEFEGGERTFEGSGRRPLDEQ